MATGVLLLRGINVGGKNKLPMADLVERVEAAGGTDVRTYIQSGNVVFRARAPKAVGAAVQADLTDRFGHEMPVVTTTAQALAKAIEAFPFVDADEKLRQVGFLSARPSAARIAALDPQRSPGDHFAVVGAHIYLWCPGGMARTKLTNAWFDRQLGVVSTFRNWKTTMKLAEMAQE